MFHSIRYSILLRKIMPANTPLSVSFTRMELITSCFLTPICMIYSARMRLCRLNCWSKREALTQNTQRFLWQPELTVHDGLATIG